MNVVKINHQRQAKAQAMFKNTTKEALCPMVLQQVPALLTATISCTKLLALSKALHTTTGKQRVLPHQRGLVHPGRVLPRLGSAKQILEQMHQEHITFLQSVISCLRQMDSLPIPDWEWVNTELKRLQTQVNSTAPFAN